MSKARTALLFADLIVTSTNNEGSHMNVSFIKKIQQDATMCQNFYYSYLYGAQHVLGDTPPIIRSLCLITSTNYTSNNCPRVTKPEAASAVLGS
jgi:hypothetical protein